MTAGKPLRLGLMGLGMTGRQIYELASLSTDIQIVAIADIGQPEILHYLLKSEAAEPRRHQLDGKVLINPNFSARLMSTDSPAEIPWDVFNVDAVIDSTGKFKEGAWMEEHLSNGAPRVFIRSLPIDHIDRIVVAGVNEDSISVDDKMISAGSSTTSAFCLLLKILSKQFEIDAVSMTSIHSFTSDQSLQDYAGHTYRRSRSAAKNIIPNTHESGKWMSQILPEFADRVMTNVLNVPVQAGCMLDTNLALADSSVDAEMINQAVLDALPDYQGIVDAINDPIVSSDVLGSTLSLLFDLQGTVKAGKNTVKTLGWHENMGHAARILDVIRLYAALDRKSEAAEEAGQ